MRAPELPRPAEERRPELGLGAALGLGLVRGFQQGISPADGPRSPSYPTGSAYGAWVLQEEGFFWGVLMIGDRLFHEADLPLGPKVWIYGVERYYDPPLYNRYWRD